MKSPSIRLYVCTLAVSLAVFGCTFLQAQSAQNAQDVAGQWNGVLTVQGTSLRLVFNISKTGEGYTSTMDSPDQGAKGIPVTTTTFDGSKLSLAIPGIGASYDGDFKTDSIEGVFKQSGLSFPLTLKRTQELK